MLEIALLAEVEQHHGHGPGVRAVEEDRGAELAGRRNEDEQPGADEAALEQRGDGVPHGRLDDVAPVEAAADELRHPRPRLAVELAARAFEQQPVFGGQRRAHRKTAA
jgi:hypothetical protein